MAPDPRSPGEAKHHYLRELKRISRAGLILEPTSPDKTGQVEWRQENTYCVSWDDWEGWFSIPYTDIFYWVATLAGTPPSSMSDAFPPAIRHRHAESASQALEVVAGGIPKMVRLQVRHSIT